jgi:phosphoribosylformimino-5-aminoimidazole carboxamide ribotide isomerase
MLERISSTTNLLIDFGGGIRSDDDIRIAFSSGARQVTGGSIALSAPETFFSWLAEYGEQKIILGADCINRKVTINGWTEQSERDVIDFITDYSLKGVKYTICTDVDKDGMLTGPSIKLYSKILESAKICLIASGGISSLYDIEKIKDTGCEGVIVGKAIYEGKIKLKKLRDLCSKEE